jgi:uncharacterized membrane protein YphA (DoxX/SURF4 family)
LAALVFISGAFNVTRQPNVVQMLQHLGYPVYLATLLGIYKLLAAITLVIGSRWPRLKEWAFAGLFFNLSGAIVAHAASGDGFVGSAPPGVLLALTGMTYVAQRLFEPSIARTATVVR